MAVNRQEMKRKTKLRKLYKKILADLKKKREYPDAILIKIGEYGLDNKIKYYENQLKRL